MSEKRELPPDWDWVTNRAACSAAKLFERLLLQAKKNVETRNAAPDGRKVIFESPEPELFSVSRAFFGGRTAVVRFYRMNEEIFIESSGPIPKFEYKGTVTLTNDGHCKLKIGDSELDEWQVLRTALEVLMFAEIR